MTARRLPHTLPHTMSRAMVGIVVRTGWVFLAILLAGTPCAWGITTRDQIERLLVLNALLFDFKMNGVGAEGVLALQLDVLHRPDIDQRVGRKKENTGEMLLVPRPRVRLWLGQHRLGAGYVPPLEVGGYQANVVSFEYGVRFALSETEAGPAWLQPLELIVRTTWTDGTVTGPITDSKARDQFDFTLSTFDTAASYRWSPALSTYGGVGAGRLDADIKVASDGARFGVDDERFSYLFGGLSFRFSGWVYTFQQNLHPLLRNFSFTVSRPF